MNRLYTRLVSFLILALARYCLKRGRYVTYTHQGRTYLRRYGILGHLTGDAISMHAWREGSRISWLRAWVLNSVTEVRYAIRLRLPNLYLHQMINPDLDTCLHDHPWPWAVSFVALGGYSEHRRHTDGREYDHEIRHLHAPALNFLLGDTFHRIAELVPNEHVAPRGSGPCARGTWTLFLAGPRRHAKPWGYLVPGQGYVSHRERHEQFGGEEKRGEPVNV